MKHRAFLPGRDWKTSVAEVTDLDETEIRKLSETVSELRGRAAKGHGSFQAAILPPLGLDFVRDDDPFERHGNLVGWPRDTGPAAKAHRKNIAQQLSSHAKLVTY